MNHLTGFGHVVHGFGVTIRITCFTVGKLMKKKNIFKKLNTLDLNLSLARTNSYQMGDIVKGSKDILQKMIKKVLSNQQII